MTDDFHFYLLRRADDYVTAIRPTADIDRFGFPAWHGWAISKAWRDGYAAAINEGGQAPCESTDGCTRAQVTWEQAISHAGTDHEMAAQPVPPSPDYDTAGSCPICGPTLVSDGACTRHGDIDVLWSAHYAGRRDAANATTALRAELERERVRLAACGVAAMQNTRTSAKDRMPPDAWAWSASYSDVCRAVDNEMNERERAERAEAERDALLNLLVVVPTYLISLAARIGHPCPLRDGCDKLRHDINAAIDAAREGGMMTDDTIVAPAQEPPGIAPHVDDVGVDRFAAAMKAKLAEKRAEGYEGWNSVDECPPGRLAQLLHDHLAKGDSLDVGNFAMMLWNRGESCVLPAQGEPQPIGWTDGTTVTGHYVKVKLADGVSLPVGTPLYAADTITALRAERDAQRREIRTLRNVAVAEAERAECAEGEPQYCEHAWKYGGRHAGCVVNCGLPRRPPTAPPAQGELPIIGALRAENERQAREIRTLRNVAVTVDERAERAEAERDALRADAERYRWLRAAQSQTARNWIVINNRNMYGEHELDAAIDAARKA